VDASLAVVERRGFVLVQPGRWHDSHIDHAFVEARYGLEARRIHFVEVGPLFSVNRRAAALMTPFDEAV
jgi:hypothetical protein